MTDEAKKPEDDATPANMVNIVTTQIGTFGEGITPIGTHRQIPVEAFSVNWMRPKTIGDRNKLVSAGKIEKTAK